MKQVIQTVQKKLLVNKEEADVFHNNFNGLEYSLF